METTSAKTGKLTASEKDGVQYKRAKPWAIVLSQMNGGNNAAFMMLMGMVSYVASAGYGIAVAVVGVLMTATRIFDGIVDPILALIIDRFNTNFGKIRILISIGWVLRSLAVLLLFVWGAGKGHNIVLFILMYMLYIVGNSIVDIPGNMMPAVMTNDPGQRPMINVWATVFNYGFPMALNLFSTMVLLPMYNNEYSLPMLRTMCLIYVGFSLIPMLIAFIGISTFDKPENYHGLNAGSKDDEVKVRDMFRFLGNNRPFLLYTISAVSDKLAQQAAGQAVVSTMLFGILIGSMQFGTLLSTIAMIPGILFAVIGGKYAGKFGNKKATVVWTWACTGLSIFGVIFCSIIDMRAISANMVLTIAFFALILLLNGAKMCVTTAAGSMRADIVDYELHRSGKYMPGIVTATYNFIDQLVTSISSTITLGLVALIGYTTVMPQPTDATSTPIFLITMFIYFGLPIIGWLCTIVAMRFYKLGREEMIQIQKDIHTKKQEAIAAKKEG